MRGKQRLLTVWLCLLGGAAMAQTPSLSFRDDVALIVQANCIACHKVGGIGPFPLDTRERLLQHGQTIAQVIREGRMPPWPADTAYRHFANERVLSKADRDKLLTWLAQPGPSVVGDNEKLSPRILPQAELGLDTLFLSSPEAYRKPEPEEELYMGFHIQNPSIKPLYVRGLEIVPSNPRMVHHGTVFTDPHSLAAELDRKTKPAGFVLYVGDSSPKANEILFSEASENDPLASILPGLHTLVYPPGMGKVIGAGEPLLLELHYPLGYAGQTDNSRVRLLTQREPIQREVKLLEVLIESDSIILPAGQIRTLRGRRTIMDTMTVLSFNTHMHIRGKAFRGYALCPNGDTIPLLSIPNWDFYRQYQYYLPKFLVLYPGTVVVAEATWDNTSKNPLNPVLPPIEVRYGNRTVDEMFNFLMDVVPYQKGDENFTWDWGLKPNN
jgi:hypothetical protein